MSCDSCNGIADMLAVPSGTSHRASYEQDSSCRRAGCMLRKQLQLQLLVGKEFLRGRSGVPIRAIWFSLAT